jgi:hypothetical protein
MLEAFDVWGSVSETVMVDAVTAVTDPNAVAKEPPAKLRPDGGVKDPPPGRVPVVPPGRAPKPPNRPPAPPRAHAPETGWLTETVVAVTGWPKGDFDDDAVVGLPKAVMHEPTVTADNVVEVVWRMVVVGV